MTISSLADSSAFPQTHSIKEWQLLVKDAPLIPAQIQPFAGIQFRSSLNVYQAFKQLAELPVETFLILHLDTKNRITAMTTISLGTLTSSLVHPREVFRAAIANLTSAVILIHNHPSGDPEPSREDVQITERLCEVGQLIGIRVLDHLVIGSGRYFSFADEGLLA